VKGRRKDKVDAGMRRHGDTGRRKVWEDKGDKEEIFGFWILPFKSVSVPSF